MKLDIHEKVSFAAGLLARANYTDQDRSVTCIELVDLPFVLLLSQNSVRVQVVQG